MTEKVLASDRKAADEPSARTASARANPEADAARATARAALGFTVGALLIVSCAFALPQLDTLIRSFGTIAVVTVFTVVVLVAGWLFWSRAEKLYDLLTT